MRLCVCVCRWVWYFLWYRPKYPEMLTHYSKKHNITRHNLNRLSKERVRDMGAHMYHDLKAVLSGVRLLKPTRQNMSAQATALTSMDYEALLVNTHLTEDLKIQRRCVFFSFLPSFSLSLTWTCCSSFTIVCV